MIKSETTNQIFPALIKARQDIAAVSRAKSGYDYKYASLDDVLNMLKEVLPRYGLGFVQFPETTEGKDGVTTIIIHDSGEYIGARYEMDATPVKGTNVTQQKGASITYTRRYSLCAAFGIATEEDTDGAVGKPSAQMTEQQKRRLEELGANWATLLPHLRVASIEEITFDMADKLIKAKEAKMQETL